MYKYHYYKHQHGRDAVIYVVDCMETDGGYMVTHTWHCLDYDGRPLPPAIPMSEKLFTYDDVQNWVRYVVEE